MLLHYFRNKENKDKKLAELLFIETIENIQNIQNNIIKKKQNNFNISFEISCILFNCIFFALKEDSNNKFTNINQELMNLFINDLDYSFRAIGISDIKIGKTVKLYVKKYYFRLSELDNIFSDFDNNYDIFSKYLAKYKIFENKENLIEINSFFNDLKILIKRCHSFNKNTDKLNLYTGLFK